MNDTPSPNSSSVDYLIDSWSLPRERSAEVASLLAAQAEGGTAVCLARNVTATPGDWGKAATLSTGNEIRPLVLDADPEPGATYLQSWRYFSAERQIAARLQALAAASPRLGRSPVDSIPLAADLGLNEEQQAAVQCGLSRRLTVITGGPGTGKTHTLARLLALMIAAEPARPWVVKLAAPTGKAADRMREAINTSVQNLPATFDEPIRKRLLECATDAGTLHRMLGYNPATGRCRADEASPLQADVIIVDECSMVDTLLWQALLAGLGSETRLILLGDPNQLESVAAGDVLGSIVRHVRASAADDPLRSAWTELQHARRFDPNSALAKLASLVVAPGHTQETLSILRENTCANPGPAESRRGSIAWLPEPGPTPTWGQLPEPVRAAIELAAREPDPTQALVALDRIRILAANRKGPWGVGGFNRLIEQHLKTAAISGRRPNLPIIINRNDPETGLKNGSVGVMISTGEGESLQRYAYFPPKDAGGKPQKIAEGRLPSDRSTAWAMTIHRSQGSEFDQVLVVLPTDEESPLASRELLYTAITRTKVTAWLWGREAVVQAALACKAGRPTRLAARLKETQRKPGQPADQRHLPDA